MSLEGKNIILAVTGSIAAYKTPQLVRSLIKAGAAVKVVATKAALEFVSALSLATVSKHAVICDLSNGDTWNNHVELGLWADAMLVAPCSTNTLAKMANGLCDNMVTAVYLSARCPVFVAPAMDEDMWKHPATQHNIDRLVAHHNHIIPVGHGELASGLVGDGRMAEPDDIVQHLSAFFSGAQTLKRIHALVTAGPTYERIDPVRYIGNFSTGKMGIAIAESLAERGATVTLVLGPSPYSAQHPAIQTVHVESAQQMFDACMAVFPGVTVAVMAAAVADYRPATLSAVKIKKAETDLSISLVKNPDILYALGKIKTPAQTLAGFALETNNEQENALKKLREKNADFIVLNSLSDAGAGFGHDTNKITMLSRSGAEVALPLLSKKDAANAIVNHIIELRDAKATI